MAEETSGRAGPLDAQLLQHLEWLTSLNPGFLAVQTGPDHVFRYANPAFQALAGSRPLLDRSMRDAFPDIADQGFHELLDQVYRTGQPFRGEVVPVHLAPGSGEQPRYLDLSYHPVRDDQGAVVGLLTHGLDVTERVRAQQQAEARLQRQARQQEVVAQLGQRTLARSEERRVGKGGRHG